MSTSTYTIIIVVVVLVILGLVLGAVFSRRQGSKKSVRYQDKFGPEYDATVKTMGNESKAQKEMDNRQKHVDTLKIRSLSLSEREKYLAEWKAVQAKFIDQTRSANGRSRPPDHGSHAASQLSRIRFRAAGSRYLDQLS